MNSISDQKLKTDRTTYFAISVLSSPTLVEVKLLSYCLQKIIYYVPKCNIEIRILE